MTKGLKMHEARRDDYGERVFSIKKLNKDLNGKLQCRHCNARVQYVSSHTKKSSRKRVDAYLKLWQGAEHANGCPFTVEGAIKQLVATSQLVEGTEQLIVPQPEGKWLFRMNVLADAVDHQLEHYSKPSAVAASSERRPRSTTFRPSGEQLAYYFRSAMGVARIRSLIQKDDLNLLKQLLVIEYKSRKISWDEFYYDDDRYSAMHKALHSGKLRHPVAVQVRVKKDVDHSTKAKRCPWSCLCYSQVTEKDGTRQIFVPMIRFSVEGVARRIVPGKTYLLVCSAWCGEDSNLREGDKEIFFKHLKFDVHNSLQLKLESDGE